MLFSGTITYDSGTSITDFLGMTNITSNNPLFQNILMGSFYSLGKALGNTDLGITLYCSLQVALELMLLSDVISDIGRRSKVTGFILIAHYCLMPLLPNYAFMFDRSEDGSGTHIRYVQVVESGRRC